MSRTRLLTVVGVLLMLTSCLLPCLTFWNGITLPDQDPTPEAIQQENAEALAFEQSFENSMWIAAALAILGLAAFIYAWKHRRRPTRVQGTK
ncbi:hypothetical protein Q2K19_24210 [Micromonospora soli]|uniref:hypothetical protein n=1 Tax=Micromonospora sp. NBRC 110009 TaxID=3061627 RepID=UPI0026725DB2|nr:hypothetical protein [Micromonospora sp. NBRC 110009]WKT97255.1 hypothetical protein Q2K19_24210 [Micromonospora sp. NBRC 110009]